MSLNPEHERTLKDVANVSLRAMTRIGDRVAEQLAGRGPLRDTADLFVSAPNGMVGGQQNPVGVIEEIHEAESNKLRLLADEPMIARVLAEDDDGERYEIYVARAAAPRIEGVTVASYTSDVGRLAEMSPGDTRALRFRNQVRNLTVIEQAFIRPERRGGWDGVENRVILEEGARYTVPSFRSLLEERTVEEAEDLLAEFGGSGEQEATVLEGFRRDAITRMGLRDQPALDKYQGDIFRLPLDRRLAITGPAGTGKTTTLIKRLAQKLSVGDLSEEERDIVYRAATPGAPDHRASWVMFTPTELLKLYVKEACGRNAVPAPDDRIRTWAEDRRRLARNVLGILRSERGGLFVLDEETDLLLPGSDARTKEFYESFEAFFRDRTVERVRKAIQAVMSLAEGSVSELAVRLWSQFRGRYSLEDFLTMGRESGAIAGAVKERRAAIAKLCRAWLNRFQAKDATIFPRLRTLVQGFDADDLDEDDDELEDDADEDDAPPPSREVKLEDVLREFQRAMEVKARATQRGTAVGTETRAGRILACLGSFSPSDEELAVLGRELRILRDLRVLANPVRNAYQRVPIVFQQFRRASATAEAWYRPEAAAQVRRRKIGGLELDAVILLMLRNAREVIERARPGEVDRETRLAPLTSVRRQWRNQVLVDEFTDFSPVQLACMYELATPVIRSFFVCGDFRQRVTACGSKSEQDLAWVSRDFGVERITVAYRQSRLLTRFATRIAETFGDGGAPPDLPDRVEDEGVPPVLAEHVSDDALADWLASRIREVERASTLLPSVAVFVDGEDAIGPLARALGERLAFRNIDVLACPTGRVIGNDNAVRVFDIAHIKGLEFEAVFFAGVDTLARRSPDLLDKYLYVGSTRAATFLGLACTDALPAELEPLRGEFAERWFG